MRRILAILILCALSLPVQAGALAHRRLHNTTAPNNVHGCVARWVAWQNVDALGTWVDATGRGHTATMYGNSTVTAGVGQSIPGASGDYARTTAYHSDLCPAAVTVAFWVYCPDRSDTHACMIFVTPSAGDHAWCFNEAIGGYSTGTNIGYYNLAGSWKAWRKGATDDSSVPKWHHFAMVIDPTNSRLDLYLDGALDNGDITGSCDAAISYNATQRVTLGWDFAGSKANDYRIYSRALSNAEIARIYAAGR